MKPFQIHTGIAVPLDRVNVDTDQIIPKQFLRKIERTGFGVHLFHDWRYLDPQGKEPNPDFSLNAPRYKGATILLTRDNFGCGSSREHAPWALADYGFKAIIAPSFADIFYNNCFKNGLVPVALETQQVDELFLHCLDNVNFKVTVNLETQSVESSTGHKYTFAIDAFGKECLLKGLDSIGWTEQFMAKIDAFEKKDKLQRPWIQA